MNITRDRLQGILIEILGWILVLVGIAALVLPGPGLLALFAGVALLATRYDWAKRRTEPLKAAAIRAAHESVSSLPRTLLSLSFALGLLLLGVLWAVHPAAPDWWPLADSWWLRGGWGVGVSLMVSGVIAGGSIVYSYIVFKEK